MKIDKILRKILKSYDVEKIDLKRDKRLIIESILNHGGDEEILWLLRTYKKEDIISVLKEPLKKMKKG